MVKFSDLLVDKSLLHGASVTSLDHQFDFYDVIYHIEPYNIDIILYGIISFLQLMNIKNIRKIPVYVQTRFAGNYNVLFKMAGNYNVLFKMAESV